MRIHVCLFSLSCWKDWWEFAMPMRLYVWGIPNRREVFVPVWPLNNWRHDRVWGDAEPVEIVPGPRAFYDDDEAAEYYADPKNRSIGD